MKQKPSLIFFILFYSLHLLGVFGFVSFFEWGSGRPLLTDDYAVRSPLFSDTRELFKTSKNLWGYSPYHLAGYPYALSAISIKGEQLFSLMLPFVNPAESLKLYILIGIATFPLLIMATARTLNFSFSSSSTAGVISILFFWKHPNVSSVRWGSISYIIACPLAMLALAFFLRFLKKNSVRSFSLFLLLGSISLLIHAIALLVILPPALAALIRAWKKESRQTLWFGFLGLLGMIAMNLFWIFPLLRYYSFLDIRISATPYFLEKLSFRSWYFQKDISRGLLLFLGLWGVWRGFRKRDSAAFPFAFGIIILASLMFLLIKPAIFLHQKFRYDWPLSLFLLFPASELLPEKGTQFFNLWTKEITRPLDFRKILLLCGTVLFLLALLGYDRTRYETCIQHLLLKEKTFLSSVPLPTSMTPPEMNLLLKWIEEKKDKEGRLLMEDSHHPQHIYWESHLPAIIPFLTGKEVVNPPLPEAPLQGEAIGFVDGTLLGKPIEELPVAAFKEYVELYNILWVICFSPKAKEYLKALPRTYIREETSIGPFSCYKINRSSNFFLKGTGKVAAGFNRIVVREIMEESGEMILKYHWFPTLRTSPPRRIERVAYGGDPVGFIRVLNPPKELEILF